MKQDTRDFFIPPPQPPAFDVPVRGVPIRVLPWRLVWKN